MSEVPRLPEKLTSGRGILIGIVICGIIGLVYGPVGVIMGAILGAISGDSFEQIMVNGEYKNES